jgi:hypothetical protein
MSTPDPQDLTAALADGRLRAIQGHRTSGLSWLEVPRLLAPGRSNQRIAHDMVV